MVCGVVALLAPEVMSSSGRKLQKRGIVPVMNHMGGPTIVSQNQQQITGPVINMGSNLFSQNQQQQPFPGPPIIPLQQQLMQQNAISSSQSPIPIPIPNPSSNPNLITTPIPIPQNLNQMNQIGSTQVCFCSNSNNGNIGQTLQPQRVNGPFPPGGFSTDLRA
jgi:hypothetical protein